MIIYYALVIFSVIGSFGAHQADVDINRLQRLPNEAKNLYSSPHHLHGPRSAEFDQVRRSNDYDDYSSGLSEPRTMLHISYPSPTSYPTNTVKIHQPRENPKLYYQSDAYVKEVNSKNIDHDVIETYPGREVIRFGDYRNTNLLPRKTRDKQNRYYEVYNQCIRCPRDRTLVSTAGSDRVVLQAPRLVTCSGHKASSNVKFVHMYGPKFGSHITSGSHVVVGRITLNAKSLQLCKMEVHVIGQSCPVPKYLKSQCDELSRSCNFTCRDPNLEIVGEKSVVCGNDMDWENDLPVCRAPRWCHTPVLPEHGRISCKGNYVGGGVGLAEGSKCRVKCLPEWRPVPRGITVCRRGVWTHKLQCQSKNRYAKG